MIYVFDTSSFVVLKNFYPSRFPSVWSGMDRLIEAQRLVSVREVLKELDSYNDQDFIQEWEKAHKPLFLTPGKEELLMVSKIFQVEHFKALISRQNILKGTPVADPFVIAAAHVKKGIVVTQVMTTATVLTEELIERGQHPSLAGITASQGLLESQVVPDHRRQSG